MYLCFLLRELSFSMILIMSLGSASVAFEADYYGILWQKAKIPSKAYRMVYQTRC